jgi:hypothetical protein
MSQLRVLVIFVISIAFINSCQSYTSGLQQSIVRADETVAITTIRTISTAEVSYNLTHEGDYATLQQLVDAGLLDSRFGKERPLKDYVITLKLTPKAGAGQGYYTCNLDPDRNGERVGRHFYVESGTDGIHVNDSQPASATDKVIE